MMRRPFGKKNDASICFDILCKLVARLRHSRITAKWVAIFWFAGGSSADFQANFTLWLYDVVANSSEQRQSNKILLFQSTITSTVK
jgi:hypothetical protein